MHSFLAGALLVSTLLTAPGRAGAADLTDTETRWLKAAWPVVLHARREALPVDIVVQPQATPGESPIALGYVDGRCKLVLSMRGNPIAEEVLLRLPEGLAEVAIELIAAHELGHCWRYRQGVWHQAPAGFVDRVPPELPADLHERYADMKATRREEAFGDLVGLAWTRQRHPDHYAALHAWLVGERVRGRIPGSHHDTLAWLRLATHGVGSADTGSIFEAASAVWPQGLAAPE